MPKIVPLLRCLATLVLGLSLTNFMIAADSPENQKPAPIAETESLTPGTKCTVTVDLACEIHEVKDETVVIRVTALREAEHGVPMLGNLPYTERLFKNTGGARTETDVLLAVPRDRIAAATPGEDKTISNEAHVRQALEHLRAAGLGEVAEQLRQRIKRQTRRRELAQKQVKAKVPSRLSSQPQAGHQPQSDRDISGEMPQVLVELKVVEISRTKTRALGLDVELAKTGQDAAIGAANRKPGWQQAVASRIVKENAPVWKLLDRLTRTGVAKILAEPIVVTLAGRPASFHSGGEFPVPLPQDDGRVATEFREYGTHVDLVAVDLGEGRLRLEIHASVSELDYTNSRTVGERNVPGLRTRTVDTTADLATGQTLIVSGLVQTRSSGEPNGANGQKPKSEEVELLLLATPRLINAGELGKQP